jgi:hypothetical protein
MDDYQAKRKELLDQMEGIDRMHEGRLSEEYRERVVDGQRLRNGPYYKHQQWKGGKNVSRRVKADEAERLREGIEGMDQFKRICEDYARTTVAMTEHMEGQGDGKKNSK